MPARHTQFRALSAEFRELMDQREAWPKFLAVLGALKGRGGRRADIVAMKRGAAVPRKYAECLAGLIREKPVMAEFLAGRGIPDHSGLTSDQVADFIAGPLQSHAASDEDAVDWHLKGINGLAEIFTDFVWRKLVQPETLCHDEEDVRLAIGMIMATAGRQVRGGEGRISDEEAVGVAERYMRISQDDYLARGIDLWRAARWTFAFAVVGRQRIACSCVLPLTARAYEDLRLGVRDSHSCSGVDLAVPSQTHFLEAVGHKADAKYPFFERKTIQAVRTIYVQLAALSLRDGTERSHDDRPLRILSIAGSKVGERRLRSSGFRRTGTKMPGFDIGLMEMDHREAWLIPLIVGKLQERLLEIADD